MIGSRSSSVHDVEDGGGNQRPVGVGEDREVDERARVGGDGLGQLLEELPDLAAGRPAQVDLGEDAALEEDRVIEGEAAGARGGALTKTGAATGGTAGAGVTTGAWIGCATGAGWATGGTTTTGATCASGKRRTQDPARLLGGLHPRGLGLATGAYWLKS